MQHGTLARQHRHFIVDVVESRANSPRIAHTEHLTRASHTADDIAAVEVVHRGLEHIAHLHVVLDVAGDIGVLKLHCLSSNEVAFHLAIKTVTHELKHDVGIAVYARTLSLLRNLLENLIDIRHVEVTAEAEVLGLPIVTTQEGMHVRHTTLTRGAIAQMSHIKLASELVDIGRENLVDGIFTLGTLAEHVLMTRFGVEFHTCDASTFLPTVVLLLHHQIELIKTIFPCAVLLFVVFERLQKAYHGNATFVFELFHCGNGLSRILKVCVKKRRMNRAACHIHSSISLTFSFSEC